MKLSQQILIDFFNEKPFETLIYFVLVLSSAWIESLLIPRLTGKLVTDINIGDAIIPIIFYWLLSQVLLMLAGKIYSFLLPQFNAFIRDTLIEKVYNKFQYEYSDVDLSTFMTRFLTTPAILKDLTSETIQGVVPRVFILFVSLYYFYEKNKHLGMTIFIVQIIGIIIVFNTINRCFVYSTERNKDFTFVSKRFHDKLSNLFSVYVSGLKDYEIEDGKKINLGTVKKHNKTLECLASVRRYSTATNAVVFIIIAITVDRLYNEKVFTKEESAQMIFTTLAFLNNFYYLMINSANIIEDLGLLHENEQFLESIESKISPRTTEFQPGDGMIVFTDVTFGYPERQPIFNNFNLTINPKDKIAFVGPSGSGKSTLMKLLLGFYPLSNGKIEIDSQNINEISLDSLRKNITYISQNTKLFDENIYYNISYGNNKSNEEIDNIVENIGIKDIFANLPNGLFTNVGINGDQLSGGQKQVIHILRGFMVNHNVVILDEPTSAIDINHAKTVKELIRTLSRDKTLILITHENSMLDLVDRQIDLSPN